MNKKFILENFGATEERFHKIIDHLEKRVVSKIILNNFDLRYISSYLRKYNHIFISTPRLFGPPIQRVTAINLFRKAVIKHWVEKLVLDLGLAPYKDHFTIIVYGKTSRGISTGASDADMKFFFSVIHSDVTQSIKDGLKKLVNILNVGVEKSGLFPEGVDVTKGIIGIDSVEIDMNENGNPFYGQLFLDGRNIYGNLDLVLDIFDKNPDFVNREKIRKKINDFWLYEIKREFPVITSFKLHQRLFDIYNYHLQLDEFSEVVKNEQKLKLPCIFNKNFNFYYFTNNIGKLSFDKHIYDLLQVLIVFRHIYYSLYGEEISDFNKNIFKNMLNDSLKKEPYYRLMLETINQFLDTTELDPLIFERLVSEINETLYELTLRLRSYGAHVPVGNVGL